MELQEIGNAVKEMQDMVKTGLIDETKMEKLNVVLDAYEGNQNELVTAKSQIDAHETEVKSLKEQLEKANTNEGVIRERVDQLEAAFARKSSYNLGEATYKETEEYKALEKWASLGDNNIDLETKQLLRTDSAVDGGVLTTIEMDSAITKKVVEIDPLRGVCRVRTISNKAIEIAIRDTIPVATYEGEADTGADSTSQYENVTVTPYRQTFTTPITKDMLMDGVFDMESEVTNDASTAFAFGEANGFVAGNGFKQPQGFVTDATLQAAARDSAAAGVISATDTILLSGDLKTGYNPLYVINRRELAKLRSLRGDAASPGDEAGQFLWQPGMGGPVMNTLNGFPYIVANSMPDAGTDAFCLAFGDFQRAYTIVDRTGMSIVRDEFTQKKKAIVEFTFNRWNTGMVTLHEGIKLLKTT